MLNLPYPKRPSSRGAATAVSRPRLLIVDDDTAFADTLKIEFEERGYDTLVAHSQGELTALGPAACRFAVLDLRVGQDNGLKILEVIKSANPDCRVVLLTGYGSIATAVQAMKLGASNYLTKPVTMERLEKALWMDLSEEDTVANEAEGDRTSLARHEHEYIEYVLSQCGGNITKAAAWLGVHRQSLQRKLRKYPPSK